MVPFIVIDLFTVQVYRWGWMSPWHALDLIIYAMQVGEPTMGDPGWPQGKDACGDCPAALSTVSSLAAGEGCMHARWLPVSTLKRVLAPAPSAAQGKDACGDCPSALSNVSSLPPLLLHSPPYWCCTWAAPPPHQSSSLS